MIILFEEDEQQFTSLGLGVLRDAITCSVTEELNGKYELEMEYPINGQFYSKIKPERIIFAKPNPYADAQPFRIYSISIPIDGTVTVNAEHISYDMNSIPVAAFSANNFDEALMKIQNGFIGIDSNPFKLINGKSIDNKYSLSFKTTAPYSMKAIISGDDENSIVAKYKAEIEYDKFYVKFLSRRGSDRGVKISYSKNMTGFTHKILTENLYDGVYPYYHKEDSATTETSTTDDFKKVYIVGPKPFQDGWLSYEAEGEPYHPIDESPVQIASDGDYKDKVFCWDNSRARYYEKIYNQTCSLIEGIVSPSWVSIDWSSMPSIRCVARVSGYFKNMTDTTWRFLEEGDVIFEGSLLEIRSTLDAATQNMMLYYSEVIPPTATTTQETSTESKVTHKELSDPIIWIDNEDAKAMKHHRILRLDLTSEFESEPTEEQLKSEANKYIADKKLGKLKTETQASFIDLSSEASSSAEVINENHVELGDTVEIIYNNVGVDVKLRVISTSYDAIKNKYSNIELGEKQEKLSDGSVQVGDGVSSLTNDSGYTDLLTVRQLIAETITADYINAKNARLSKAMISELETAKINCSGIIEASQFSIDNIVAKMLVAENATISKVLNAGTIKISGDLSITKGSINISNDDGTSFTVTRDGKVTATDLTIKGGEINIQNNDTGIVFSVDRNGHVESNSMTINGGYISIKSEDESTVFIVDETGKVTANDAIIKGEITATSGEIGGAKIEDGILTITKVNVKSIDINNATASQAATKQFKVESNGTVTIIGGKIEIKSTDGTTSFIVERNGKLTANSVKITGGELLFKNSNNEEVFKVSDDANTGDVTVSITGTFKTTNGLIEHCYIGNSMTQSQSTFYIGKGIDNSSNPPEDVNDARISSNISSFYDDTISSCVYISPKCIRLGRRSDLALDNKLNPEMYNRYVYQNSAVTKTDIELENGKSYLLSLDVANSDSENQLSLIIYGVDSEGNQTQIAYLDNSDLYKSIDIEDDWEYVSYTAQLLCTKSCTVYARLIMTNYSYKGFVAKSDGSVYMTNANISGAIYATSGDIGGAIIKDGKLVVSTAQIEGTITANEIELKNNQNGTTFSVDSNGVLYSNSGEIGGFIISNTSLHDEYVTSLYDPNNSGVFLSKNGIRIGRLVQKNSGEIIEENDNTNDFRAVNKNTTSTWTNYIEVEAVMEPNTWYTITIKTPAISDSFRSLVSSIYAIVDVDGEWYKSNEISVSSIPSSGIAYSFDFFYSGNDVNALYRLYAKWGSSLIATNLLLATKVTVKVKETSSSGFMAKKDGTLIAKNMYIKSATIKDTTITSGSINIQNSGGTKTFSVSQDGDLYANSGTIGNNVTFNGIIKSSNSIEWNSGDLIDSWKRTYSVNISNSSIAYNLNYLHSHDDDRGYYYTESYSLKTLITPNGMYGDYDNISSANNAVIDFNYGVAKVYKKNSIETYRSMVTGLTVNYCKNNKYFNQIDLSVLEKPFIYCGYQVISSVDKSYINMLGSDNQYYDLSKHMLTVSEDNSYGSSEPQIIYYGTTDTINADTVVDIDISKYIGSITTAMVCQRTTNSGMPGYGGCSITWTNSSSYRILHIGNDGSEPKQFTYWVIGHKPS